MASGVFCRLDVLLLPNHLHQSIDGNSEHWCQMGKFCSGLIMAPYGIGQAIIFSFCGFYLLSSSIFFSSPNLSGRRLDVYHTSTYGVALV